MADINRELALPAEFDNRIVSFIHENLADGEVLKLKAGWLATGIPKIYSINYCVAELTTDANVANRVILIRVYKADQSKTFLVINVASGNIAASITDRLIFTKGIGLNSGATIPNDIVGINDLIISGDDFIEVSITNDAAGDLTDIIVQAKYLNQKSDVHQEQ